MRVHIRHQNPATHRGNSRLFSQVIQSRFVKTFTYEIVKVTANVMFNINFKKLFYFVFNI